MNDQTEDDIELAPMGDDAGEQEAPVMERRDGEPENAYRRSIYSIPVNVQVSIGSAKPTIAELLQMKRDSLIQLNSKIDDPVELCVDNRVIARGELVESEEVEGGLGVKLTEIVDITEDSLQ